MCVCVCVCVCVMVASWACDVTGILTHVWVKNNLYKLPFTT